MPHASPFTQEIFDEWKRIVDQQFSATPEQTVTDAELLFAKWFKDGQWLAGLEGAHLIASKRWSSLAVAGRLEEAVAVFDDWFKHPEWEQADPVDHSSDFSYLMSLQIVLGREDEAMESFRQGLIRGSRELYGVEVQNMLMAAAHAAPDATPLPVWRELMTWACQKTPMLRIPPEVIGLSTYAEVVEAHRRFTKSQSQTHSRSNPNYMFG